MRCSKHQLKIVSIFTYANYVSEYILFSEKEKYAVNLKLLDCQTIKDVDQHSSLISVVRAT